MVKSAEAVSNHEAILRAAAFGGLLRMRVRANPSTTVQS
jgi:hypothetical protein